LAISFFNLSAQAYQIKWRKRESKIEFPFKKNELCCHKKTYGDWHASAMKSEWEENTFATEALVARGKLSLCHAKCMSEMQDT
jgi:hypothetical protein